MATTRSSSSSKRKRASDNTPRSSNQDLVSVPGQDTSPEDNADTGDAINTSPQAAQKSDQPSVKKAKKTPSDAGSDDESNSSNEGSDSGEQRRAAADKPNLPPPEKGGTLAPKGYSMNPPPTDRAVRVYADGVFDLFHLGHMRQLEQAKKAFDNVYLLVGIPNDNETHKRKGITVLNDKERAETLRHCKWVDEVIEDAPWIVTPDFLEKHDIDYVAHDDEPYAGGDTDDIYRPCKEEGKFLVTQRTEGISTTYIITKIVRDYEKYISRQLKRGTSRQELNVSWLKKNELDVKRHINEFRDSIKTNWTTTGRELRDELGKFWAPSPRPASPSIPFLASGGGNNNNNNNASNGPTSNSLLPPSDINRSASPSDFATGYSLGLLSGVRSWMKTKGGSARGSMTNSPTGSEGSESDSDGAQSPSDNNHKRAGAVETKA